MKSLAHIFNTFVTELSSELKIPLLITFLIQFITNFQLTYLLLQQTLDPEFDFHLKVLKFIRITSSYVVGFDKFKAPEPQIALEIVWGILCAYLLVLLVSLAIFMLRSRNRNINRNKGFKVLRIVTKMHSKLVFLPIHYYFMWVISYRDQCGSTIRVEDDRLHCGVYYLPLTILAGILNFAIGFFEEFFCYQIKKSKDIFSGKNTWYFKLLLAHKAITALFIMLLTSAKVVTLACNLIFSILYCATLLITLPFYNIRVLKFTTIFAASHFTISVFVFIFSFKEGQRYLEALVFLSFLMIAKIFLGYLNMTIKRILSLRFRTPQEALHILPF